MHYEIFKIRVIYQSNSILIWIHNFSVKEDVAAVCEKERKRREVKRINL